MKKTTLISIALIAVLGFAVYANSLSGKFIWDDRYLVKDNVYIKKWSNAFRVFNEDIGAGAGVFKYYTYRPLQMLTYMTDYSLWKLNVQGYHLTNILLHILVALSIFWLVNLLYGDWLLSLFTSLVFVVHPIHTEVVTYISGRADSLAAFFMLFCLIFYIKGLNTKSISLFVLMLLSYVLALLSRENALVVPLLLLLYHYSFKEKLRLRQFLPMLSLAFVYIVLRLTLLRHLLPAGQIAYSSANTNLFQRLPGFFVAVVNYLRLLFLPFNQHMEYGSKIFDPTHFRAILGAALVIALLLWAWKERRSNALIFFCIFWFFIALLPSSNLYPLNAYMAEHWLYLPSIGFCLILTWGLKYLLQPKQLRLFTIILVILLSFYSYLTIKQNNYWRNPLALYEMNAKYSTDSSKIFNNLGANYFFLGRNEEAIASYKKAIEINPRHAEAYNNLGAVYYKMDNFERAAEFFNKAIELNPTYAEPYTNLGRIYSRIGRNEETIASYKKAIEISPNYPQAHYILGNAYYRSGSYKQAVSSYREAIELDPNYAQAYSNLGLVYKAMGREEQAIASYKKAITVDSNLMEPYNNLAVTYNKLGRYQEAASLLEKAVQIRPDCATAYYNLGLAYFAQKQYTLAIEACDRAKALGFEIDPRFLKDLKPYR